MSKTRHIQIRMSQRGISEETLELVERFGAQQGEHIVLGSKACQELSRYLSILKRKIDHIGEQGGFVLVKADGQLITTYRLNSFSFKKARAKSQEKAPLPLCFTPENVLLGLV